MLKHYNITVKGKVQGVWYRKSTQNKAQELGVTGFVKNLPNGDVYIEAEGNENQLKSLLDWCAIGPEFAKVTQVLFDEAISQSFTHFEIKR
ncbi:acylphosphatase [Aquimarina gracilis]|uniref:acylphosphatase n=1 Tax=Aquimarina gracilis TaxID=874422 RepID=A0ABU5ZSR7_9FLAO|nr:acylphosphatase [Aquimarina gracilis]MEB3344993.1 acylphosphatase [Aquimarina gracilis]